MVWQEEAETGEYAAEEAAGEETSSKVLAIGDCELRSLLNIPILPILSGTFASKSYGPSLCSSELLMHGIGIKS